MEWVQESEERLTAYLGHCCFMVQFIDITNGWHLSVNGRLIPGFKSRTAKDACDMVERRQDYYYSMSVRDIDVHNRTS